MEKTVKLYTLSYNEIKTYLFATLFIAGNIIFPQLCHLIPGGGFVWLPIYFFTLIASYKYGIKVGLLTAILSPMVNSLIFGMPAVAMLPIILTKSVLLASVAAYVAHRFNKVAILPILIAVLSYQVVGIAIEWIMVKDLWTAVQDFRIGIPGLLLQLLGGYALLKAIAKL